MPTNLEGVLIGVGIDASDAKKGAREYTKYVRQMVKDTEELDKKSTKANTGMGSAFAMLAKRLALAAVAWKAFHAATDSARAAARYETLGVVLDTVGRNIGYSSGQMAYFTESVREMGITMSASRSAVLSMAQAQVQLSDASSIARLAQDAAVIGGINSSEALQRLVYGLQSAQVEVLRTIGINVNFERSYKRMAAQLGVTTEALSESDKITARVNAVMEAGLAITGAYEAAMGTAGKQVTSLARYAEDAQVKIGGMFQSEFQTAVLVATALLKRLNEELDKTAKDRDTPGILDDLIEGAGSGLLWLTTAYKNSGLKPTVDSLTAGLANSWRQSFAMIALDMDKMVENTEEFQRRMDEIWAGKLETPKNFGEFVEAFLNPIRKANEEVSDFQEELDRGRNTIIVPNVTGIGTDNMRIDTIQFYDPDMAEEDRQRIRDVAQKAFDEIAKIQGARTAQVRLESELDQLAQQGINKYQTQIRSLQGLTELDKLRTELSTGQYQNLSRIASLNEEIAQGEIANIKAKQQSNEAQLEELRALGDNSSAQEQINLLMAEQALLAERLSKSTAELAAAEHTRARVAEMENAARTIDTIRYATNIAKLADEIYKIGKTEREVAIIEAERDARRLTNDPRAIEYQKQLVAAKYDEVKANELLRKADPYIAYSESLELYIHLLNEEVITAETARVAINEAADAYFNAKQALGGLRAETESYLKVLEASIEAQERIANAQRSDFESIWESQARQNFFIEQRINMLQRERAELEANRAVGIFSDQDAVRVNEINAELAELEDELNSVGRAINEYLLSSFDQFFNDLIDGTMSVEDAFKRMLSNMAAEAAKFFAQQAIRSLFRSMNWNPGNAIANALGLGASALSGAGSPMSVGSVALTGLGAGATSIDAGAFNNLSASGLNIPGLANGGSFTVGGSGPLDSKLVAFRASPGERVDVTKGNKRSESPMNITINVPIQTPNGYVSRETQHQTASRIGRAVQMAMERS